MEKIFELRAVSKVYGKNDLAQEVLKKVGLDIYEQDIVSIVGPSGAGKTTLLNVLSGLERISDGDILYKGKSIKGLSEAQLARMRLENFGFVFQNYCLVSSLSVRDNIVLARVAKKKKVTKEELDDITTSLGIEGKLNSMPNQLSGGEKQRVAIARAIIAEPDVIFADEPTGNLDSENGNVVFDILFEMAKKYKKTLIYVTHDPQKAELAPRRIVVKDGMIHEEQ